MRKIVYLGAVLAIISLVGATFAQGTQGTQGNQTGDGNVTVEPLNLQGIWRLSLAGTEITMALNQSGDSIFGQCKLDGTEPWNGVVAGSISGRAVYIAMAAMRGEVLATTMLSGVADGDAMIGSYVRADDEGNAAKGEFQASRISEDTSSYTPAVVNAAPASGQSSSAEETSANSGRSRTTDVRVLKSSIDPMIFPRHAPL